jgi:predicted transcriptional regulator
MLSVLLYIDNDTFDKAFNKATSGMQKRKAFALGKIGEEVTKGVFKSKKEATTASGKADILDVPLSRVSSVLKSVEGKNSVAVASINKMIEESMGVNTIDIEAKATSGQLGGYKGSERGTLKITQTTPSLKKADPNYVERQKILISQIVELGMTGKSSKDILKLFDALRVEVDGSYTFSDIKKLEEEIYKTVNPKDITDAYNKIMSSPKLFNKFMQGPFGSLITDKIKNLTVQVNAKAPSGKKLTFFQTFINLKFSKGDIVRRKSGNTYRFYLSSAFERKLVNETKNKLLKNAVGTVVADIEDALSFNLKGKTGLQQILQTEGNLKDLVNSLSFNSFEALIPSGGSIDLNFGVDATNLLNSLNSKIPKILASNLAPAASVKKGRFASASQLTSLLRLEVYSRMKKSGKAKPPTLTYRTGRFVENLEVAQVNYKKSIIKYYSLPLYYSLEDYGYEVEELIEGSIREISQNLYSRQFNLVSA